VTRDSVFVVGSVMVHGDLVLAPMAGFSDSPYRLLCRALGSAISYTECIPATGFVHRNPRITQSAQFDARERPVVFQVIGSEPEQVIRACLSLQELAPDWIDINMGCPAPRASSRGAGAGLLREPTKIAQIFAVLSKQLKVPVSGKIRLGWDRSSRNHLEVARILEDNGASLIAVHGRTGKDKYGSPADWDAIAQVKQAVSVPVLGNGDVRTVADIERIRAHTRCDGVMIGRGAIGNPWIFRRRDLDTVSLDERIMVVRCHLDLMLAFYGERLGVVLFRKHLVRYVHGLPGATDVRSQLMSCRTRAQVLSCLTGAAAGSPDKMRDVA
jgi:tRNA-dihydrouridine synthase B